MFLVKVWIEYATLSLDRPFSYLCYDDKIKRGKRVVVRFNHRDVIGFVESVERCDETPEEITLKLGYKLSFVLQIIDEESLIDEELFALSDYMSKRTISSRMSCFQAMLPAKLKPQTNNQRIKTEVWVKKADVKDLNLTCKQRQCLALLNEKDYKLSLWRSSTKTVGKTLETLGYVIKYTKEVEYVENEDYLLTENLPLTPLQEKAKLEIVSAKQTAVLLHGVTGSGKTEVYLQLAQDVVASKKQVLILVPEISLTPQMVKRVRSRFGSRVAIYHSALNNQEKYEQFKRVKKCEVDVVVGTRSAVFMPFHALGLIICDEEHDSSYKQDSTPLYHCKDIALWRANYHDCKLILGSATPSLDSYARALKGVYQLVEMPIRINKQMPDVILVDVLKEIKSGGNYILSRILVDKIQDRLNKNEQVLLLLNRRGYSPTVRCKQCHESLQCPHCDVALSYHRQDNTLKCHICNYTTHLTKECPVCFNDTFQFIGVGTQRLCEELQNIFVDAKIERMDADTTARKNSHQKIFESIENHEIDILVGTQIISKGMDYPDVTLVGIINGDAGLNRPDFYSVENTFQLIVQASGRSGRSKKTGEVIIQAFEPNHYAIALGAKQDYKAFFYKEMNYRHLTNNPPYSYLICLQLSNVDQKLALKEISHIKAWLDRVKEGKLLGPSSLVKLQDSYRYRLVLKGKNLDKMIENIHQVMNLIKENKFKSKIKVDTTPTMLE